MRIIQEGSIGFRNGEIELSGWIVEGGTQQELIDYALSKVPINFILFRRFNH